MSSLLQAMPVNVFVSGKIIFLRAKNKTVRSFIKRPWNDVIKMMKYFEFELDIVFIAHPSRPSLQMKTLYDFTCSLLRPIIRAIFK